MEIQSESSYVRIYHLAVSLGLFNSPQTDRYEKVTNAIPLVRVNNWFFGSNKFADNFNYLNLAKENIVHKEYGIYYLSTKKLENYLEYVCEHLKLESTFNLCPYNYYKFMENLEREVTIPAHYQVMCKTIDNFLKYLDNINNLQSKNIRHILTPGAESGVLNKLECEVSDVLALPGQPNEFVIKLVKPGKPIFLRFASGKNSIVNPNVLVLSNEPDEENFSKVYNYINTQLLMETPEEFLICNIERVCGSRVFAEIMVKSYLDKTGFVFSLDSISSVILWASVESEKKFISYFCGKYPECVETQGSTQMVNFEGINKFFLNISEDDVANFDVKEQINEMYYNSMYELIHSFEQLYNNRF